MTTYLHCTGSVCTSSNITRHKTLSTLYCQSARLSPILQTAVSQNRQREILDGGDCEQREDGEEI